ncbi:helix-turn-helix domain-containing protein [Xylophilus rhododendri]|uniref:Helix-turn-helix domain-containing protein n=1 Tax=Xylophilus rhododendri TaxID=2697032 RepID=A0A857J2W1_9BURK|nr:IclR family transcriptional regulator C-terminal domain-containing protein [Xylophilus rhododendri]QHI97469.1 helix-turn-helix domain-containing protein [Xylophilus rhododendri]
MNVKQAANVLDLIEFFAEYRRPATLAEIARHFDWPRSSAFNLLGTLAARGFLYEPRAREGYYPTPQWAVLIGRIEQAQPIPAWLHELLQALVEQTGETAALAAASGAFALFIDAVESPHAIRYTARSGKQIPMHVTATGRALLSQMQPQERATILRKAEFRRYTDTTLMSAEAVEQEIARSSQRGWFLGQAEYTQELGGVAIPLGLPHRQLAVLVGGPTYRLQGRIEEVAAIMTRLAGAYLAGASAKEPIR